MRPFSKGDREGLMVGSVVGAGKVGGMMGDTLGSVLGLRVPIIGARLGPGVGLLVGAGSRSWEITWTPCD